MFFSIFLRFFLIGISETSDGIQLLDMLDAREELIKGAAPSASLVRVFRLLFARRRIAGSWCASET